VIGDAHLCGGAVGGGMIFNSMRTYPAYAVLFKRFHYYSLDLYHDGILG
jgi:hypothetical protein